MTRSIVAARAKQRFSLCSATLGLRAFSIIAMGLLTACAQTGERGFSFAAGNRSSEGHARLGAASQAVFAKGEVVLVPPPGHCLDKTMLLQENDGGFALFPRCNLLQGPSFFGRNRAALITAAIGPAKTSGAPSPIDLARTAEGAKLLYYDNNGMLPLVRLHWPGHGATGAEGATGASAEHWRGAFVLNDHMIVLALYAPEGSPLLGTPGAELLTEMTRRTLEASLADRPQGSASQADSTSQQAPSRLRPRTRPAPMSEPAALAGASTAQETSEVAEEKLSLRRRIAGLFK